MDLQFYAALGIVEQSFELVHPSVEQRTADGRLILAPLGSPVWRGSFVTQARDHRVQAAVEAAAARVRRLQSLFLWHDARFVGPAADPSGAALGAATPTVHSSAYGWVRIQGLPPGYVLGAGDWLGWAFGPGAARRALHRVASASVVAGPDGLTGAIDVEPPVRAGVAPGAAVQLIRPACAAIITGMSQGPAARRRTGGLQVSWTQVV